MTRYLLGYGSNLLFSYPITCFEVCLTKNGLAYVHYTVSIKHTVTSLQVEKNFSNILMEK